jgi:hypothetical protein
MGAIPDVINDEEAVPMFELFCSMAAACVTSTNAERWPGESPEVVWAK